MSAYTLPDHVNEQCVEVEWRVRDISSHAARLTRDLESLQVFGTYASEAPGIDNVRLAQLLAAHVHEMAHYMLKDLQAAETALTTLLAQIVEMEA